MNTPIQTLYLYLEGEGLFNDWLAPDGSTQPAPLVQMRLLEEEDAPSNERILLIKATGSGGATRFTSNQTFTFAVLGMVGESAAFAEAYANLVYESLRAFMEQDSIYGLNAVGNVNGAYKMESGRKAYDMEFDASIEGFQL